MGNITLAAKLQLTGIEILISGRAVDRSDPDILERAVRKEWNTITREKRDQERQTAASVVEVFDQMQELALENADRRSRSAELGTTRADTDNYSNLTPQQIINKIEARDIAAGLRKDIVRTIREGFKRGAFNAGFSEFEFSTSQPLVQGYIRDVLAKTKGIGDTTVQQLGAKLQNAISKGATLPEIKRIIREYFKQSKDSRVSTIAQTVTNTSYETGQLIAFDNAGVKYKEWVSVRDGRVRPSHWRIDGTAIALNDEFKVGNAELLYPSDPEGPAAEVINCRCSMLPATKATEDTSSDEAGDSSAANALEDKLGKYIDEKVLNDYDLNEKFLREMDELLDADVPVIYKGGGSHYSPRKDHIVITKRAGTSESVIYHEYAHALHFRKKVITYGYPREGTPEWEIRQKFDALYDRGKKAIGVGRKGISKFSSKIDSRYAEIYYDADPVERQHFSNMADVIASLTKGNHGHGHSKSYFRSNMNMPKMELFAHCLELRYSDPASTQHKYFDEFIPDYKNDMIETIDEILELMKQL